MTLPRVYTGPGVESSPVTAFPGLKHELPNRTLPTSVAVKVCHRAVIGYAANQ